MNNDNLYHVLTVNERLKQDLKNKDAHNKLMEGYNKRIVDAMGGTDIDFQAELGLALVEDRIRRSEKKLADLSCKSIHDARAEINCIKSKTEVLLNKSNLILNELICKNLDFQKALSFLDDKNKILFLDKCFLSENEEGNSAYFHRFDHQNILKKITELNKDDFKNCYEKIASRMDETSKKRVYFDVYDVVNKTIGERDKLLVTNITLILFVVTVFSKLSVNNEILLSENVVSDAINSGEYDAFIDKIKVSLSDKKILTDNDRILLDSLFEQKDLLEKIITDKNFNVLDRVIKKDLDLSKKILIISAINMEIQDLMYFFEYNKLTKLAKLFSSYVKDLNIDTFSVDKYRCNKKDSVDANLYKETSFFKKLFS